MKGANSDNIERANNYTSGEISEILQAASTMFNNPTHLQSSRASSELKVLIGYCLAIYYLALFVQSINLWEINLLVGPFHILGTFASWIWAFFSLPSVLH
ncbi:hypothetical protein Q9L58_005637 [Maublancomyces gigas]|uniref:Uncharacterized protein n=1 Tax=Discina gigas TaxID=1032678 RepID=A0ABR3GHL1_9PEZI